MTQRCMDHPYLWTMLFKTKNYILKAFDIIIFFENFLNSSNILGFLITLPLSQLQYQMNKNSLYSNSIWEQLIQFSLKNPIDWSLFQKEFQIKKLELEKLNDIQIREKKEEFQRKYMVDHQISKSWMENEYRLYIWFIFTYSKITGLTPDFYGPVQWNVVSECFSKDPLFCKYFYLSSKKTKSSDWSPDEDKFIDKMMKSCISKKWTEIGLELFKRSDGVYFRKPKSIRERWLSHLNPEIKKDDWEAKQDLMLIKNIKETGRKWSKISKIFGNRTQHTIKNRYFQLFTKYEKMLKQQKCFSSLSDSQKLEYIEKQILESAEKSQSSYREEKEEQVKIKKEEMDDSNYLTFASSKHFLPIILSKPQIEQEKLQQKKQERAQF